MTIRMDGDEIPAGPVVDSHAGDVEDREIDARVRLALFDEAPTPVRIGRYVVLGRIGYGAMGVVYSAFDEKLGRRIAVKVVRRTDAESRRRTVREAQALARLAHPNVVTVHDVNADGEDVWIAMEYVSGKTLSEWASESVRPWYEALPILTDVVRGVAAAHAEGLVHRDLKPDNIMIGDDGRVRVLDFGLAHGRVLAGEPLDTAATLPETGLPPTDPPLTARLTPSHTVQGTPAYLSPEQWRLEPAGAASDQFGWSVMAWEILFGERPFAGETWTELCGNVLHGTRRAPSKHRIVPGWLRRVVDRGLEIDPARRWPSMQALQTELARGQTRATLRRVGVGLSVVGLVIGAGWAWRERIAAGRVTACVAAGASIDEVWNDDTRARVRAALVATDVTYAAVTADKLMPWLDRQAEAWRSARTATCLDAEVRAAWDGATHVRSLWCLDDRRTELATLVRELEQADASAVPRAVVAAAGLTPLAPCRDAARLSRLPLPPLEQRGVVREVRAEMLRVASLERSGEAGEALQVAHANLGKAQLLAWAPLRAAARYQVGRLLDSSGRFLEAEHTLEQAYFEAAGAGAFDVAADVGSKLTMIVGDERGRHEDGLRWSRHTEVALAALADEQGLRAARNLFRRATVLGEAGRYAEAKQLHLQALHMLEAVLGPEHPDLATVLNNLGLMHHEIGEYAEAKLLHERSMQIKRSALGFAHPSIASSLNNLGNVQHKLGDYRSAKALFEQAIAIAERARGPSHPELAYPLYGLAIVHEETGEYAQAKALHERALAIWTRALGPEHVRVANSVKSLGDVHLVTGDYRSAAECYRRALAIREKALPRDHQDIAGVLVSLGTAQRLLGEYTEAKKLLVRALSILDAALGPGSRSRAHPLTELARLHDDLGEPEAALPLYEEALALNERAFGSDHPTVAPILTDLADIYQSMGEHDRAKTLHERTLATHERLLGPDHHNLIQPLAGLANVALSQHDTDAAVRLGERAVRIAAVSRARRESAAAAQFVLARALWESGHQRDRALSLAEQAREGLAAFAYTKQQHTRVVAWLERHRGGA